MRSASISTRTRPGGDFDGRKSSASSAPRSASGAARSSARSGTDSSAHGSGALTDIPVTSGAWWKGAAKSIAGWFGEEKVTSKAAALAFYTAFSLAPIVLLLMLLFGFVIDTQTLQTQL